MYREILKDLNDSIGRHAQVLPSLNFFDTRIVCILVTAQQYATLHHTEWHVAHGIHGTTGSEYPCDEQIAGGGSGTR